MAELVLSPGGLTLASMHRWLREGGPVRVDPSAWGAVEAAARLVGETARQDRPVYGITTGFGSLARTRIGPEAVEALQRNLVLSHAAGTGRALGDDIVRLVLLLKAASLALGHSGVERRTIEMLIALLNADLLPEIPGQGSVGASGDLAPLAHLAMALIGEGRVRHRGETMPAADALARAGLRPLTLGPKEGLALLNGTQVSTGLALAGLFAAEDVLAAALVAGALSVDAMLGSDVPFRPEIQRVRGQPGQARVAAALWELLHGSEIRASHLTCDRVQDPYSLRCQPQVMGACLDLLDDAARRLGVEANGVSDNPLVFAASGEILSGGNFHAEPVAFAADMIALALAEIGNLAERRVALLVDAHMSGLPAFLVAEPGLNSGFMIPQVTAAALASENKLLAHPASIDTIPTSAGQEDHVSMATHGARRLLDMSENAAGIAAIELLAAAQGIDFRRPLATSPRLGEAMRAVRSRVPFLERDRPPAPDIAAMTALVREGTLRRLLPDDLLPSARL